MNMNDGIYCRWKEPNGLYDCILIDEYNKSISLPHSKFEHNIQFKSKAMKNENTDENEWKCGMNVRAIYSEDGEYYEAIIEDIHDEDHVLVQYHGYENREFVNVKDLRSSKGLDWILKQISVAKEKAEDEKYNKDPPPEIDWEVGMPCRGLYDENETIYEATIQEIDERNRSALLMMSGFGVLFKAQFEDMYESIPEYRLKQEAIARKYIEESQYTSTIVTSPTKSANENTSIGDKGIIPPKISDNETIVFDSTKGQSLRQCISRNRCLNHENVEQSSKMFLKDNPTHIAPFHGIMKPETEVDALACLVSSNYLSGYYAGYYDCMIQLQKQKRDTKS